MHFRRFGQPRPAPPLHEAYCGVVHSCPCAPLTRLHGWTKRSPRHGHFAIDDPHVPAALSSDKSPVDLGPRGRRLRDLADRGPSLSCPKRDSEFPRLATSSTRAIATNHSHTKAKGTCMLTRARRAAHRSRSRHNNMQALFSSSLGRRNSNPKYPGENPYGILTQSALAPLYPTSQPLKPVLIP